MAEVKKLSGGDPTPSEILVNVDNTTIKGDGSRNFPLHAVNGGGTGIQSFRFVATGGETSFVATLPTERTDALYNAWATGGGLHDQLTFDCPVADYTPTQFTVIPSGALTAGDVVILNVASLT